MSTQETTRQGSPATVFATFLHFDLCFTIWVLLGALSIYITKDLHLNAFQQGVMVAIPTLSGALFRLPMGLLGDRFGGKRVGTIMLLFLILPLLIGWLLPLNFSAILGVGLMLGVAGASFSVALPMASHWYTSERQGLIMGIAAAGNIGTVVSTFFGPRLAARFGWHGVMGLVIIPLVVVLITFVLLAKDSPTRPTRVPFSRYMTVMKQGNIWLLCLFYSITFGGFVGLGTFLPLFFHNQYGLSAASAGAITALAALLGSSLRPLGGYIADKIGGVFTLSILLAVVAVLYATISFLPTLMVIAVLIVAVVACLGMGNGAVFQIVPQHFQKEIGVATGLVGALGGIGGFLVPILLGSVKQISGTYAWGLGILALLAVGAFILIRVLATTRASWHITSPVPASSALPVGSTH
jgi:MFS transporter, NNP family, nitrate/nitrite transporter